MKSHEIKEVMKKKEALEWYVDFVNMDLETIKPGDKAKLLIEVIGGAGHLYPYFELSEEEIIDKSMSQEEPKMSRLEAQVVLNILRCLPDKESEEHWELILNLQEVVKNLFCDFQKIDDPEIGDHIASRRIEDVVLTVFWGKNQPFEVNYFPITKGHDNRLRCTIIKLLEGFPGHALSVCPVCNKFFLNTSFRKKEFCSPNCMWKSNSAKQRKKDPEKYRKYQRELMRKKSLKKMGLEKRKLKEPKQRSKAKGGK